MMEKAAREWGERPFIEFDDELLTYSAFKQDVERLAAGLHLAGIKRGETVCALLDTSLVAVKLWFASNLVGAIYVPLNSALKGELLVHQVNDSLSRVLITDAAHMRHVALARSGFAHHPKIVVVGDTQGIGEDYTTFDNLLAGAQEPMTFDPADAAAPSLILYTSGTTGPSKGCIASHAYVTTIARKVAKRVQMTEFDVSYSTLPLFHIFGMCGVILACMSRGAQVVLRARFSVSAFWADVEKSGATIVNAVGSMIPLIAGSHDCTSQKNCFGQIRVALGIPFTPAEMDRWKERFGVGWVGNIGYGMTEAATITEVDPASDPRLAESGRPVDFDVRIVNDFDEELLPGETGEIVARPLSPGIMFDGYWQRPRETSEMLRNLWFHTGDLGRFNSDGNLVFVDRKKDYMRSGGENVSSYEVETVLKSHPHIADVAAYSVESELSEDEIKISVVLSEPGLLTEDELFSWCVERLPRHCVPHHIELLPDLPRSPTGKILKFELKGAGLGAATWSRKAAGRVVPR